MGGPDSVALDGMASGLTRGGKGSPVLLDYGVQHCWPRLVRCPGARRPGRPPSTGRAGVLCRVHTSVQWVQCLAK